MPRASTIGDGPPSPGPAGPEGQFGVSARSETRWASFGERGATRKTVDCGRTTGPRRIVLSVALLLAGIDEAGYGPTLGPLCVGLSVFRLRDWKRGDPAPDLWQLLSRAVCKKASDARGRIPIADSKSLKLSNDSKTRHPLLHLERGVLAFLRGLDCSPATDSDLFRFLRADLAADPWYAGDPVPIPLGQSAGQIAIVSSRLAAAMEEAGVELVGLSCRMIHEREFNRIVERTGTKAEATGIAFGEHLRRLAAMDLAGASVRLVCDQLGGRTSYEGLIGRELPGSTVTCLTESGDRSRYAVVNPDRDQPDDDDSDFIVQFMPEAEAAHLPVALASMVAKLTRELAMSRFNRYWCARCPELKPTAGYSTDARRWLGAMRDVLADSERAALVRMA